MIDSSHQAEAEKNDPRTADRRSNIVSIIWENMFTVAPLVHCLVIKIDIWLRQKAHEAVFNA